MSQVSVSTVVPGPLSSVSEDRYLNFMNFKHEQVAEAIACEEETGSFLAPLVEVRNLSRQQLEAALRPENNFGFSQSMSYPIKRPGCSSILFIDAAHAATLSKVIGALKLKKIIRGCLRRTSIAYVFLVGQGEPGSYAIVFSPTDFCLAQISGYHREYVGRVGHFAVGYTRFLSEEKCARKCEEIASKKELRKKHNGRCIIS